MKYKRIIVSTMLLLGLALIGLHAQENLNTTGAEASGVGGTASYSVGQVVYNTNTGTNGSVAQGVQQPYEISVVTAIEAAKGIHLSTSVYPNPATDYLILSVADFESSTLTYQLYDMNGKLLQYQNIESPQTTIVMGNLLPAVYFVKVTAKAKINADQQELTSFKIIKK